ncbi:MAG: hypothetical protein ACI8TP_005119, partial [Acidimicrobiales bacterium]
SQQPAESSSDSVVVEIAPAKVNSRPNRPAIR